MCDSAENGTDGPPPTEEELLQEACMSDRKMGYYVLSSVATFAAFLLLVLVPRVLSAPCRNKKNRVSFGGGEGRVTFFSYQVLECIELLLFFLLLRQSLLPFSSEGRQSCFF